MRRVVVTGLGVISPSGNSAGELFGNLMSAKSGVRRISSAYAEKLSVRIAAEVDFDPLVINEVHVMGCLGGPNMWEEAIALHVSGRVQAAPIITHRLPLEYFATGVEIARQRIDNAIKVILQP